MGDGINRSRLHFLRLQDARRIGNENGPLFVELNYLYRQALRVRETA